MDMDTLTQRFSDLQKQGFMKLGRKNVRKAKVAKPIVACDECHDWHVKGKHTSLVPNARAKTV